MLFQEEAYQEVWNESDIGTIGVHRNPISQENPINPIVKLFFLQLIMWQMIFRVSDSAIKAMMVVVKKLLHLLSGQLNYADLNDACDQVPNSYNGLLKYVGLDAHNLNVFVVCTSCSSIYNYDECVTTRGPLKCRSVAFPNHPHRDQRVPCNAPLLKEIKVRDSGKTRYVPLKTFPYQSLKIAITDLVANPSFLTICDHWRKRCETVPVDILADVYDGAIWRDFNSDKFSNFLKFPGNLLLSLNTDWFQPFTRTKYSVGVLYLVVLNLPRNMRYKIENIILCGIIPGPKEPKLTMNSFVAPLVKELNDAYKGWMIPTKHPFLKSVYVRLCIGSVVCDIPATRKLCGFLGHSARFGCNKCLKEFPTESFGRKPDFSGYNRSDWEMRTKDHHKNVCSEWLKCQTKSAREYLESSTGIRYSVLIDLPLFDPVSFVAIDPMHNLLLGTAKHVMSIWIKTDRLTQQDLQVIQEKAALLKFPYDVGRIPIKIASTFSGFTADQWRTWTTIISPIVLKGVLQTEDLNCWLIFVNACRLMLTRIISLDAVSQADNYLVLFCRTFQRLYGSHPCSPNQHLHMHLKDCFLNFGPIHAFWAFAFERLNGMLGTYHTNNKNIEEQIMLKFVRHQKIKRLSTQDNVFSDVLLLDSDQSRGSIHETEGCTDHADVLSLVRLSTVVDLTSISFEFMQSTYIKPLPPMGEKVLSRVEVSQLQQVYGQLYPRQTTTHFSLLYMHYKKVLLGDELLGSGEVIMAYWPGSGSSLSNIDYSACRAGIIKYFLKHSIKLDYNNTDKTHLFCYVTWKQKHPLYNWFGKSAIVSSTLNEVEDGCCFMPIQRIAFRCASGELPIDFGEITERVLIASPVSMKFCM